MWRSDRTSLSAEGEAASDAETNAIRGALEEVLDETFNAPSLYDSRDLRRK